MSRVLDPRSTVKPTTTTWEGARPTNLPPHLYKPFKKLKDSSGG